MDRGAWWTPVPGVAKSWTRLGDAFPFFLPLVAPGLTVTDLSLSPDPFGDYRSLGRKPVGCGMFSCIRVRLCIFHKSF